MKRILIYYCSTALLILPCDTAHAASPRIARKIGDQDEVKRYHYAVYKRTSSKGGSAGMKTCLRPKGTSRMRPFMDGLLSGMTLGLYDVHCKTT